MTPTGFEPSENSPGKQANPQEGGAESGAFSAKNAPETYKLEAVVAALKGLSPADRARLAALLLGEEAGE
jgi:hypothetical protein